MNKEIYSSPPICQLKEYDKKNQSDENQNKACN